MGGSFFEVARIGMPSGQKLKHQAPSALVKWVLAMSSTAPAWYLSHGNNLWKAQQHKMQAAPTVGGRFLWVKENSSTEL